MRCGWIYSTILLLACFIPLGTVSSPDTWCERQALHFSCRYANLKVIVFVKDSLSHHQCQVIMKLLILRDLHIHADVHRLPENSSPSFISLRWISSCRVSGHGYQDWRYCKFKLYFRVVLLWIILSFLDSVTESISNCSLMVESQCCEWTWKLVGRHSHESVRFWALGESSFVSRRWWLLRGCLGFYRQTTRSEKDQEQRLKCGMNKSIDRMNQVGSSKPNMNARLQVKRAFNETC